jgi:hypothetical protein
MELVFLGHQSWLISHGRTNVLLDPLLLESFGHSPEAQFQIYPPRTIDHRRLPKVSAVILSHEHLDHFHLPSIALLPTDTPVITGVLTPNCVVSALEQLHFNVLRMPPFQAFRVGDLELTLYPGAAETIFWEKRVNQVYIRPSKLADSSVFVAVDALISETFKEAIGNNQIPVPRAIICSNNSQVVPPGAFGAHSNLLPVENDDGFANGIKLLYEITVHYLEGLPPVPELIICGNGFVDPAQEFGPFLFSDQDQLASTARKLGNHKRVHGPMPGDKLDFNTSDPSAGRVDWITVNHITHNMLLTRQASFLKNPTHTSIRPLLGKFESEEAARVALDMVIAELPSLARAILVSPLGNLALCTHEYLSGHLGPRRVLLRLLEGPNGFPIHFALDFARAEFVLDTTATIEVLQTYPFGLEVHLIDLVGVMSGRLQIWDLAGTATRSWFIGDIYSNFVSFLYCHYGEQVRPDLAFSVYSRACDTLLKSREV